MLEIRPNCEYCDKDLPPQSEEAFICTYECTFCRDCVDDVLKNVCPNCGGGFEKRPVRPSTERRNGVSLSHQKPSTKRVNTKYTREEIDAFSKEVSNIPASNR